MTREALTLATDTLTDVVHLLTGLAWPVVVGVVLWRMGPSIKKAIDSRGFTVKVAGTEITVQQASDQLAERLDDIREQVSALKVRLEPPDEPPAGGGVSSESSPISVGVPRLGRVLWVDDHPENNVYEIAALRRKGVDVVLARTTAEAATLLGDQRSFEAIISDMGRVENGAVHDDAGVQLIRLVRDRGLDTPIVVYASAPAVARTREEAFAAGAVAATSSATELLDMLGRMGLH